MDGVAFENMRIGKTGAEGEAMALPRSCA